MEFTVEILLPDIFPCEKQAFVAIFIVDERETSLSGGRENFTNYWIFHYRHFY